MRIAMLERCSASPLALHVDLIIIGGGAYSKGSKSSKTTRDAGNTSASLKGRVGVEATIVRS